MISTEPPSEPVKIRCTECVRLETENRLLRDENDNLRSQCGELAAANAGLAEEVEHLDERIRSEGLYLDE